MRSQSGKNRGPKPTAKEVVVPLPAFLAKYRPNNPKTVCIDAEIVETIQHLWAHEIETTGCCSGHGKQSPSVIIAQGYGRYDIARISSLIAKVDDREWTILQWRLAVVSGPEPCTLHPEPWAVREPPLHPVPYTLNPEPCSRRDR